MIHKSIKFIGNFLIGFILFCVSLVTGIITWAILNPTLPEDITPGTSMGFILLTVICSPFLLAVSFGSPFIVSSYLKQWGLAKQIAICILVPVGVAIIGSVLFYLPTLLK